MTRRPRAPIVGRVSPSGRSTPVKVALVCRPLLGELVTLVLRHADAECRTVAAQAEARAVIRDWSPELLIADLDHWERAPEWTRPDPATGKGGIPCLGLMRRRETQAKFEAFERGAADIIEVPFTPDEIVVRSIACVRRASGRDVKIVSKVRVGRFEMDLMDSGIRLGETRVKLTLLEQTLLYLFLAHPGEVLTREEILTDIWGSQSAVTSNVIDRHIRDLRVKLQEEWREPRFIETVAGKGYRFIGATAKDA